MALINNSNGLTYLKIYSGSTLLTSYLNEVTITGSGVTAEIGEFNNLTLTITNTGGGSGSADTGSLLVTASFSNPNLTFTKGNGSTFNVNLSSLVITSASYALTSSYINGGSF
jgi:hypothetical protein